MGKTNTFKQLIEDCGEENKHLLLGNGWSIGFYKEFAYTSLLETLKKVDSNKKILEIFDILKTSDFERVLYDIYKTKEILDALEPDNKFNLTTNLEHLKNSFIKILGDIHPRSWDCIEESSRELFVEESSKKSLEEKATSFLDNGNFTSYFTINYDLLLYWILNKQISNKPISNLNDGFRKCEDNKCIFQETPDQNIFYLHGGLHLHNSGTHKRMYTNGNSIIDSMKKSMDDNEYPTIILEGSSEDKTKAINQSPYLHWCHTQFSKIEGSLFIHGFSFKDNDAHIYNTIFDNSKLKNIYIGLHQDDKNEVKARLHKIRIGKKAAYKFYDAMDAGL